MENSPFSSVAQTVELVTLHGELDLAVRELLARQFGEVAALGRDVLVDMSDVTYLDSSAIGALVGLRRELAERNAGMVLRMSRNAAYRLVEIAGLTTVFDIELV
ncbi:MAG TPA: STAS domain-containing protein [Candidatus Aquilonibacter sp.]|nr:STAS domain-containing protein [Candidatus Aquilonibacter sp.]